MDLGSKVLVATDLSEAADQAIRQGYQEARAANGRLVVCHVIPNAGRHNPLFPQENVGDATDLVERERRVGGMVEARVTALTGLTAGAFDVVIETGPPDASIVRIADEVKATLIVVGSRGQGGIDRLIFGRVAERVVRYAQCAVLVARAHPATGRVLVPTDFSPEANTAVATAIREAQMLGARTTLVHSVDLFPSPAIGWGAPFGATWVVPPRNLVDQVRAAAEEALKDILEQFNAQGDILVVEGDPGAAILKAALDIDAERVVIATRGHTGIARMVLGRVAERVVSLAHCSVLAVRKDAAAGK